MGLRGPLRWAGRGMALCSGLLPLTGAIPPGGAAAWILLTLALPLLLAGELAEGEGPDLVREPCPSCPLCGRIGREPEKGGPPMTAQHAIHELKQVRQYCSARAIPAIDYAIQVLQGLADRERQVEEEKAKGPQGPVQPEGFPD